MKRRYYQQAAIDKSREAAKHGTNKQLIVIPVGGGKSIVIGAISAERLRAKPNARGIIVTHRKELGEQNAAKLRAIDPSLEHQIGIEKAESRCIPTDRVMMASIQTVGKKGLDRVKAWCNLQDIDFVLIDEAHHVAGGKTYQTLIDEILAANPQALITGFTATPKRGDGERLEKWFDKTVYEISLAQLIREKFLAPFHGWKIRTTASLADLDKRAGDFVIEQLAHAVNQENRNQLAADIYVQKHFGSLALSFCVDKKHAEDVCAVFAAKGIPSAFITEDTSKDDRERIIREFRAGTILHLAGCEVFTEGFDVQNIKVLFMLRPTRSPVLYEQMLGRGSRLVVRQNPDDPEGEWIVDWEAKSHCDVYDFCDIKAEEMGVQSLSRTVGINPKFEAKGEDLFALKKTLDIAGQTEPYLQLALLGARSKAEIDQLLQPHNPLQEIRAIRRLDSCTAELNWVELNENEHWLVLTEGELVRLVKDALGCYMLHVPQIESGKRAIREQPEGALNAEEIAELSTKNKPASNHVLQAQDLDSAVMEAERIVMGLVPNDRHLLAKAARWKRKGETLPITDGQIKTLQRFKVPEAQVRILNKTEASEMIDALIVKDKILARQKRLAFGQYRGAPAHLVGIYDRGYLTFLREKQPVTWQRHKTLLEEALANDCLGWLAEYRPHLFKENVEAFLETYEKIRREDPRQFRDTMRFILEQDPANEWRIIMERKNAARSTAQQTKLPTLAAA